MSGESVSRRSGNQCFSRSPINHINVCSLLAVARAIHLLKEKGYAAEYDDFSDVAAFVVLTILIVRLQGIGLRKRIKRFRLKFGRTGIKPREPRRCLWTRGLLERLDGVYIKCSMYACSYTLS